MSIVLRRLVVLPLLLVATACEDDGKTSSNADTRISETETRLRALEERVERLENAPVPLSPAAPPATPAKPVSKSRVTIELTADGMTLDGEAVAAVALRAQLEAIAAQSPDATVTVRADDDVPHAKVVETMDEVKKAGLAKIAVVNWSDD